MNFCVILIIYWRICIFISMVIDEVSSKIRDLFYINWASGKPCLWPKWPWSEAILTSHWPGTLSLTITIHNNQSAVRDLELGRRSVRISMMVRSQNVWFIAIVCMWSVMDEWSLLSQTTTINTTINLELRREKFEATNILWEDSHHLLYKYEVVREGWL